MIYVYYIIPELCGRVDRGGEGMDTGNPCEEGNVGKRIGAKLRQFRLNKGMSLDALARQIGVSKLTLLNIERGEANPTLAVIWKIAKGLNIPIAGLLDVGSEVSVSRGKAGMKLTSPNAVFVAEPMFCSHGLTELYRGYLHPRGEYFSEAHQPGVVEYVAVMSGRLTVEVDGEVYELEEYDSIRFRGDRPHKYVNPSSGQTVLHFVISYNNP